MDRLARFLFFIGLIICLLQIWLPAYFVTGDGPCHIYNARIIHDLLLHRNMDLFNNFFHLSHKPNPNWLSHFILVLLMFLANGIIAEKILLTGYILLFVTGFSTLLRRLGNGDRFLPLVVFVFVFNHILIKGFYNFSLSIAIFFWVIEVWLRYLDSRKIRALIIFFILVLLSFFTHPMAFVYSCITCFALTASSGLSVVGIPFRDKFIILGKDLLALLLCFTPGFLLFVKFAGSEGGTNGIHLHVERYRLDDLLTNHYLISYDSSEQLWANVLAGLFIMLFAIALIVRLSKGIKILRYDGLLVSCALAGLIYLYFPDTLLGGGAFSVRAHYILFLLGTCCIAWLIPWHKVRMSGGIAFFICFIALSAIRLPVELSAADGVKDYTSASAYIKPNSVVLPLDFSPNGKGRNGKVISDRNWLFYHAAQYMGAGKPLIMLDNYEANVGYFPLLWQDRTNPYIYLSKGRGFEGQPPFADLSGYKQSSGVTVDYIVMWCYDSSYLHDDNFRSFYNNIKAEYNNIYTSPTGRTMLYQKK